MVDTKSFIKSAGEKKNIDNSNQKMNYERPFNNA